MDATLTHETLLQHLGDHEWFIRLANARREALIAPPQLSFFRVYAFLLIEDSAKRLAIVEGTNSEPSYLGGSICAERAALVQLPRLGAVKVTHVYIVTDSETPASPGVLCREYLSSVVQRDTPIVLGGCNSDQLTVTNLSELWPCPDLYIGCNRDNLREVAGTQASRATKPTNASLGAIHENIEALYNAAVAESARDDMDALLPLRMGAAVMLSDGSIETAWQMKGLEYGCTLDAISPLLRVLANKRKEGIEGLVLMQADEFGVLHAPVAQARALLNEHGFGDMQIVVHSENGELAVRKISDLVPSLGYLTHDTFKPKP